MGCKLQELVGMWCDPCSGTDEACRKAGAHRVVVTPASQKPVTRRQERGAGDFWGSRISLRVWGSSPQKP